MRNRRSLNCLCLSLLLAAFVLSLGLGGYFWQQNRTVPENGQKAEVSLVEQAKKKVAVMSPEQRVGQLMMIGIMGTSIDQDAAYQISQYHAGNIILFDRNMQSRQQVLSLNENLRRQIQRQTNDIPPFIAIDQEGGFVLRMREAFPRIPSEQQLGEDGDPGAAETWAAETGKELKKWALISILRLSLI